MAATVAFARVIYFVTSMLSAVAPVLVFTATITDEQISRVGGACAGWDGVGHGTKVQFWKRGMGISE